MGLVFLIVFTGALIGALLLGERMGQNYANGNWRIWTQCNTPEQAFERISKFEKVARSTKESSG